MTSLQSCTVRSVTVFIRESDVGLGGWQGALKDAARFLQTARSSLEERGMAVQTLRVATDILRHAHSVEDALRSAASLLEAAAAHGVTFVSFGAFSDMELLKQGLLTKLLGMNVSGVNYTCCTFLWQQGMGWEEASAAADAIFSLGRDTGDVGPFHFAVMATQEGFQTPFFPAASAAHPGFAIATENSDQYGAALGSVTRGDVAGVTPAVQASMTKGLAKIQDVALALAAATGVPYLGIDTSLNPSLEGPTLSEAFESVGLGSFGNPGTLAVAERLTAAVKTLPGISTTGYCGLMLPLAEDRGLAAAAPRLSVQTLLFYSTVCGCGLDTVPVPGIGPDTPPAEAERLRAAAAALILDIAGMAARLRKPLTCRLLPVAGAVAGAQVQWPSPYLVPSAILPL